MRYASEDKVFVEKLAEKLSERVKVWFDQFELQIGESLRRIEPRIEVHALRWLRDSAGVCCLDSVQCWRPTGLFIQYIPCVSRCIA